LFSGMLGTIIGPSIMFTIQMVAMLTGLKA